ncbi:amidase [Nonomuraea sp. SYSU D8015]|uniref:amidase n=1 Tax=Nonomuraea sp. SYSU D8015 TaxID=2593644 RepID=UPI001CB71CFD|nr:amidase [Nonomuraea sp. SYSU D8015]
MSGVAPRRLHRSWSLRELVTELRRGLTSPAAALERAQARIAETDPELLAWVEHCVEPDMTAASGPLGGVPLGVKDIIDVVGLPTRCGSALRAAAAPATVDATIVGAWRSAGAVPIGKTVTTEFAYFSPGPTRNPAALGHTPGGSSSGSAAAVASGQVPLAIGSQTAGSVTRPASYCGVAALVMSHGRLPVDGVTGLSPSLDSHGVFAASASDLAVAWSALTGAADVGLGGSKRLPRVLVWSAAPLQVVGETMRDGVERATNQLVAAGATVAVFPDEQLVTEATMAHSVVMAYEAARERADELAVASQLSDPLATLLRTGAGISAQDYATARRTVATAARRVAELLEAYDVVLGPAATGPAPLGLDATGDPVLSRAWQALGLPVVTVPGLTDDEGLPLGLQIVGRPEGEDELLEVACWVEPILADRTLELR